MINQIKQTFYFILNFIISESNQFDNIFFSLMNESNKNSISQNWHNSFLNSYICSSSQNHSLNLSTKMRFNNYCAYSSQLSNSLIKTQTDKNIILQKNIVTYQQQICNTNFNVKFNRNNHQLQSLCFNLDNCTKQNRIIKQNKLTSNQLELFYRQIVFYLVIYMFYVNYMIQNKIQDKKLNISFFPDKNKFIAELQQDMQPINYNKIRQSLTIFLNDKCGKIKTFQGQNKNHIILNQQNHFVLGKGAYGKVYKAIMLNNSEIRIVAVKVFRMSEEQHQKEGYVIQFSRQESILKAIASTKNVNNDYTVKYFDKYYESNTKYTYLVMEFCEGDTAIKLIKKNEKDYKKQLKLFYFIKQVTKALYFLHFKSLDQTQKLRITTIEDVRNLKKFELNKKQIVRPYVIGIIHRDIKPSNVIIHQENQEDPSTLRIKLIDFGLSRMSDVQNYVNFTQCGTVVFQAPQITRKTGYNASVDIYSLSIMVLQMLSGQELDDNSSKSIDQKILQKFQQSLKILVQQANSKTKCMKYFFIIFFKKCLNEKYTSRWNSQNLLHFILDYEKQQVNETKIKKKNKIEDRSNFQLQNDNSNYNSSYSTAAESLLSQNQLSLQPLSQSQSQPQALSQFNAGIYLLSQSKGAIFRQKTNIYFQIPMSICAQNSQSILYSTDKFLYANCKNQNNPNEAILVKVIWNNIKRKLTIQNKEVKQQHEVTNVNVKPNVKTGVNINGQNNQNPIKKEVSKNTIVYCTNTEEKVYQYTKKLKNNYHLSFLKPFYIRSHFQAKIFKVLAFKQQNFQNLQEFYKQIQSKFKKQRKLAKIILKIGDYVLNCLNNQIKGVHGHLDKDSILIKQLQNKQKDIQVKIINFQKFFFYDETLWKLTCQNVQEKEKKIFLKKVIAMNRLRDLKFPIQLSQIYNFKVSHLYKVQKQKLNVNGNKPPKQQQNLTYFLQCCQKYLNQLSIQEMNVQTSRSLLTNLNKLYLQNSRYYSKVITQQESLYYFNGHFKRLYLSLILSLLTLQNMKIRLIQFQGNIKDKYEQLQLKIKRLLNIVKVKKKFIIQLPSLDKNLDTYPIDKIIQIFQQKQINQQSQVISECIAKIQEVKCKEPRQQQVNGISFKIQNLVRLLQT